MAFSSRVVYTGDNIVTQFNIPFPFISGTHVRVFVNETLMLDPMNYTRSSSTIIFNEAPESDAAIVIDRQTSPINTLVDFVDGSVLNADDLDTAYLHNFYLGQEYADSFNRLINEAFIAVATGVGIVETETDLVIAALVNEMLGDAAASDLQQRVNDIDTNAEAIIQLGTDIQIEIDTLADGVAAVVYIQAGEPTPGVGGIPDPILDGARWYDSDDNNKSYIYDQTAVEWVDIDDPRIGSAVTNITVLQANVITNAAAVVTEAVARADSDSATASLLTLIGAQNGGGTAFILDLDTVEVGGDETLATRFTTITSDKDTNAAAITSEATTRATADSVSAALFVLLGAENGAQNAFILDTSTVKIDSDQGDTFATRLAALATTDGNNAAAITTEESARITAVSAEATARGVLQVEVDDNSADVTTNASAIATTEGDVTTLEARYGVSLNVNDFITGFLQHNDGNSGSFIILADKFAVVTPSTVWAASTAYTVGQMRRPTSDNSRVFKCTTAGTSGGSEPTWDTVVGNTTNDGTVVWTTFDDVLRQPFLINGDKITMNADVIIDGDLLVTGSINGNRLINATIGTTQIGPNAITTTQLNASAVTTDKLDANSVTSDKITVTNLQAVSANVGELIMNAAGHIRGGQTAYDTGTGFFLGYTGGKYKFSIGDSGGHSLTWDGTVLSVVGAIANANVAGDITLIASIVQSSENTATYIKKKTFVIGDNGTVRIHVSAKRPDDVGSVPGIRAGYQVKEGANVLATTEVTGESFASYTDDFSVTAGDVIDVYIRGANSTIPTSNSPITTEDIEIRTIKFSDALTLDIS